MSNRQAALLPLRDIVVFPYQVVPLFVGRERSIAALQHAMENDKAILLAAQKKAKTNEPDPDDIFEFGTLANIVQLLHLPDGTVKVIVEGKQRVQIHGFNETDPFFLAEMSLVELKPMMSNSRPSPALFGKRSKVTPNSTSVYLRKPSALSLTFSQPWKNCDTIADFSRSKFQTSKTC